VSIAKAAVVLEGKGNGVYRTTWNGDVYPENKVLEHYRDEGEGKRVWEFTRAS
jgi:hypothetical protein